MIRQFFSLMILCSMMGSSFSMQTSQLMGKLTRADLEQIKAQSDFQKEKTLLKALFIDDICAFKLIFPLVNTISKETGELLLFRTINSEFPPTLNAKIVKMLAQKVDIHYGDPFPPLEQAVDMAHKTGRLEVVEALLELGADPCKQIGLPGNGRQTISIFENTLFFMLHAPEEHPHASKILVLMLKHMAKRAEEAQKTDAAKKEEGKAGL